MSPPGTVGTVGPVVGAVVGAVVAAVVGGTVGTVILIVSTSAICIERICISGASKRFISPPLFNLPGIL